MLADSAASVGGASDARPPAFFREPLGGDLLPDTLPDFLAVLDFVFAADDFVSEFASDDCASELRSAADFLTDDFALPIT